MNLLTHAYYDEYAAQVNTDFEAAMAQLTHKATYSTANFEYNLQASAVYSSNIEGNSIDIDSYLKNKKFKIKAKPKEMTEIDDLILAYNYTMNNPLNAKNFLYSHKILSRTALTLKSQQDKLRTQQVGIFSNGKIEYLAVEPEFVPQEYKKLFDDMHTLKNQSLSLRQIFYFAAMIHLLFEKIHPFMDGNGRAGRLLEKWFLADKINKSTWAIQTEKYYAQHRPQYYQNIHIGYNYYALKMEHCLPFLLMLPAALHAQYTQSNH
jgi:Fic family protein